MLPELEGHMADLNQCSPLKGVSAMLYGDKKININIRPVNLTSSGSSKK